MSYASLEEWRVACRTELAQVLRTERVGFVLPSSEHGLISCSPDLLEPAIAWEQHYHALDVGMYRARTRRVRAYHMSDLFVRGELRRLEIFHGWVAPYELWDGFGLLVHGSDALLASLHAYGDAGHTSIAFQRHGRRVLASLHPAFEAGVRTAIRWNAQRSRLLDFLDQSSEGARVLDVDQRLLHQTPAFGMLLVEDPDHLLIEAAVGQAARAAAACVRPGSKTMADDAPRDWQQTIVTRRGTYRVRASTLESLAWGAEPRIVVTLARIHTDGLSDEELRARYGLTIRESRVARALCRARPAKEIAQELGISVHTVRRHAESIYAKLGVHSRSEVERLLRLPAPPPPPGGTAGGA